MPVQKAVLVPGLLFALLSLPQELGDQDRQNPGPGDPYPEDFVYDISGGGQFRLADFKGRKAVLIANHIVDDGSVSWHADPFKRLKELQAKYKDRLAIAVMPEQAHHRQQTRDLWEATAAAVRESLNPGDAAADSASRTGASGAPGPVWLDQRRFPSTSVRSDIAVRLVAHRLNRQGVHHPPGRAVISSLVGNTEHMIFETELRPSVVSACSTFSSRFRQWSCTMVCVSP